jgi:hypothetical protein
MLKKVIDKLLGKVIKFRNKCSDREAVSLRKPFRELAAGASQ